MYNDGQGLYTLEPNSEWSLVESGIVENKWVEVYRYDTELKPDKSTTLLAGKVSMKNMTLAEFAEITDVNVSMTGYVCRTTDADIDNAWEYIKVETGM